MNRRGFLCSLIGVPVAAALSIKAEPKPFVPKARQMGMTPEFPLGTTIATSSGTYTYVRFINPAQSGQLVFTEST